MANEFLLNDPTAGYRMVVLRAGTLGLNKSTPAWETFNTSNMALYGIVLSSADPLGDRFASMPAGTPAKANVNAIYYQSAGGTMTLADGTLALAADGPRDWDGTAFIGGSLVLAAVSALSPATPIDLKIEGTDLRVE